MRHPFRSWFAAALLFALLPACVRDAAAIPAFARRYGVSCAQCHAPIPRLNAFGDMFAGHGFRMAPGEPPADTLESGDELLALGRSLPLAIRFDAHARLLGDDPPESDFQTPYGVKLLSSAPLSPEISYYLYFFLFERGEVGGIEDAFVYWNDVGGRPVDLAAGQFQVSDPLFKRELRLEFDDYVVYRARIGLQPTDLTYDRGLMAIIDAAGFTLSLELLNGNGKGPASGSLRYDDDPTKNVFAHATREAWPGALRLGALGYWGRQDGDAGFGFVRNRVWMAGADATITAGPFELNLQYLHREDDHATFDPAEPTTDTDGGFAELLWAPDGARTYGFALYNRIEADRPLLDPRMGGTANVDRYESIAAGAGYLVRRNLRGQLEGQWDVEAEQMRWTASLTFAH